MAFIEQEKIFEATDGGRYIIEKWLPQSAPCFTNAHRKFKWRTEEKTASASVKRMPDGIWVATDFGGDSKPLNAIQVVMLEEGISFGQAINLIAAEFGLVTDEQRASVIKPEIRQREATAEEAPGTWHFKVKDFSVKELKTFIAPKVWEWLISNCKDLPAEKQEQKAVAEVLKVLTRYRFYSLESYTVIKDRTATEIRSTETFPIFFFDEGTWKKIYKPKEILASNRFIYYVPVEHKEAVRLKEYVFGLQQVRKAYDEVKAIDDTDVSEEEEEAPKKKKKPAKLQTVFMCSGGSDALNLAIIGQCFSKTDLQREWFYPIWMNSETANLPLGTAKNIFAYCENFINIPDIDKTGLRAAHKLATEHLNLKTLYLPEELKEQADTFRKKPLKDLRDYFKYYKVYDFHTLLKTAYPYRFWDAKPPTDKNPKWTYSVNNKHLYNFLARNGFYRFETEAEKEGYIYIQIEGNTVRKLEPKKIRDFVNKFIELRNPDVELMNTFLRTNQLSEGSLSNLPFIKIDFTDFDRETQWFFFLNGACEVKANGITFHKPGTVDKYVWENEVIKRKVKLLEPMFSVGEYTDRETRQTAIYLNVLNNACPTLRFLTATSRLYWREELETRITGIQNEREAAEYMELHGFTKAEQHLVKGLPKHEAEQYKVNHKWEISGPLLTYREQMEQRAHLLNKLFAIGYLFHRNKENAKTWAIWAMDAKLSEGDESHGGTGKSLFFSLINNHKLMNTQYREGRNPRLIDNPHFWEGTDKHTDLVLVDDCNRYLKFDFFFSSITGPITVNPKNNKQYTIDFTDAPKLVFTSNYPPFNADISMERRILYWICSDYYHFNRLNEYNEDRTVMDDFGKSLGTDFTEQEWNQFLNLIMQCTQFFLSCPVKVSPPMENVNKRNLKNVMGEAFEAWADVYFGKEGGRLDKKIVKEEAVEAYLKAVNPKIRTTNNFTHLLKAWCRFNSYELNPKEYQNTKGRIIERQTIEEPYAEKTSRVVEMIYIKTQPIVNPLFEAKAAQEETSPF